MDLDFPEREAERRSSGSLQPLHPIFQAKKKEANEQGLVTESQK